MRYPRDQRQTEIVALATRLAQQIAPRAAEHDREGSIATESFQDLIDAGYHRLTVPAEFGGTGATMIEFVLAQNALARGDEAVALGMNMHLMSVANAAQSRAWPPALFARIMREVVNDGALLNSAAAEPELGSPAGGGRPQTQARAVGGGWLVSGRKTFTSLSPILTYYIVLATIGERDGGIEVGQFLVRRGPGVRIEPTWDVMAMRSTASHDIVLEEAFVPESDVLSRRLLGAPLPGAPGGSFFSLGVAAVYQAIAESARDEAVEFARTRVPTGLGRPIGTLPTIQHRIAQMDVLLMSARELLLSAAQDWTDAPAERAQIAPKMAAAKYLATNNAIEIVDLAMRIVGGVALFRSSPLERYYRNVRAGLSHPPIDDRAFEQIARAALQLPGPPSEPPVT